MPVIALLALVMPPEYLTEVVSPVYEAAGTPPALARRAEACLSQQLGQTSGGPVILSSDPEAGVVVASNALEYRDGMVPWRLRSRVTFEGRDGRFRITHTTIERLNDQAPGAQYLGATPWGPIGKWWGSGWQKAQQALVAVSDQVAACVTAPSSATDDW